MAIRKTLSLTNNFGEDTEIKNAYIRVLDLCATKHEMSVNFEVLTSNMTRRVSVIQYKFTPSLDGVNFIAQAYFKLKQTDDFIGSEDC